MKNKLLKTYTIVSTPAGVPGTEARNREECHQALIKVLDKLERRLVIQIIDAKDRIVEDTSIDSFISGFELAWKLSMELNNYESEHSVSCRTAKKKVVIAGSYDYPITEDGIKIIKLTDFLSDD